MDVGFIGLGAMGRAMATNLAKAGHQVVAWNRSAVAAPDGVVMVESARLVGERTSAAFVMVSNAEAVEEVVFGANGWAEGAAPGAVLIQSSTIGPDATERLAARIEAGGLRFLDAPVSGSVKPAQNAQLVILGGGDQALFDSHQVLFDAIAKRTVVFGPVGSGSTAKLAVNGLLVAVVAAAAESLSWMTARAPHIEMELFASVIDRISPLAAERSGAIAGVAPSGGFTLRQAAKDMELVGAEFHGAPLMEAVRDLTRRGLAIGLADRDVACLGEVVRNP